jgi:ketosteroid isomerase-like protein
VSEENVALARQLYDAINSIGPTGKDFVDPEELMPEFWAKLAPDFELRGRPDIPDQKTYRGPEESKEFWRMLQDVWAEIRWEPLEFHDLGEAVVVETRLRGVGRGSDVPIEADETDVFWFRDGKLAVVTGFATKEEAFEAARESAG